MPITPPNLLIPFTRDAFNGYSLSETQHSLVDEAERIRLAGGPGTDEEREALQRAGELLQQLQGVATASNVGGGSAVGRDLGDFVLSDSAEKRVDAWLASINEADYSNAFDLAVMAREQLSHLKADERTLAMERLADVAGGTRFSGLLISALLTEGAPYLNEEGKYNTAVRLHRRLEKISDAWGIIQIKEMMEHFLPAVLKGKDEALAHKGFELLLVLMAQKPMPWMDTLLGDALTQPQFQGRLAEIWPKLGPQILTFGDFGLNLSTLPFVMRGLLPGHRPQSKDPLTIQDRWAFHRTRTVELEPFLQEQGLPSSSVPKVLNRSHVYKISSQEVLVIKYAANDQEARKLIRESLWTQQFHEKGIPLRSQWPRPILSSWGKTELLEIGGRKAIAFKASADYYHYLDDPHLPFADFSQGLLNAVHDAFLLARHGVYHTTPLTLFHLRDDPLLNSRFDKGLYIASPDLVRNSGRGGPGMIHDWPAALQHGNAGVTGLRDAEELATLSEIRGDRHWRPELELLNSQPQGIYLYETILLQNVLLLMLYVGQRIEADSKFYSGSGEFWRDDMWLAPYRNLLRDMFATAHGARFDVPLEKARSLLDDRVDWKRYARQLAFHMSRAYVSYLKPDALLADFPDFDLYGSSLKVMGRGNNGTLMGPFSEADYHPENGFVVSLQEPERRNLGPDNGPLPIQEFEKAAWAVFVDWSKVPVNLPRQAEVTLFRSEHAEQVSKIAQAIPDHGSIRIRDEKPAGMARRPAPRPSAKELFEMAEMMRREITQFPADPQTALEEIERIGKVYEQAFKLEVKKSGAAALLEKICDGYMWTVGARQKATEALLKVLKLKPEDIEKLTRERGRMEEGLKGIGVNQKDIDRLSEFHRRSSESLARAYALDSVQDEARVDPYLVAKTFADAAKELAAAARFALEVDQFSMAFSFSKLAEIGYQAASKALIKTVALWKIFSKYYKKFKEPVLEMEKNLKATIGGSTDISVLLLQCQSRWKSAMLSQNPLTIPSAADTWNDPYVPPIRFKRFDEEKVGVTEKEVAVFGDRAFFTLDSSPDISAVDKASYCYLNLNNGGLFTHLQLIKAYDTWVQAYLSDPPPEKRKELKERAVGILKQIYALINIKELPVGDPLGIFYKERAAAINDLIVDWTLDIVMIEDKEATLAALQRIIEKGSAEKLSAPSVGPLEMPQEVPATSPAEPFSPELERGIGQDLESPTQENPLDPKTPRAILQGHGMTSSFFTQSALGIVRTESPSRPMPDRRLELFLRRHHRFDLVQKWKSLSLARQKLFTPMMMQAMKGSNVAAVEKILIGEQGRGFLGCFFGASQSPLSRSITAMRVFR